MRAPSIRRITLVKTLVSVCAQAAGQPAPKRQLFMDSEEGREKIATCTYFNRGILITSFRRRWGSRDQVDAYDLYVGVLQP